MLVLIVLACALCLSLVTGGRLRYVQDFQLRALPVGVGAFVAQALMFTARGEALLGSLLPVFYMLTMIALLVFLFVNRTVFGMPVLMVGLVLNLLVIGANGGRIPADPRALIATGQSARAELLEENHAGANCVLMTADTHLNFLGDRIVLPLLGTLGAVYSVGDLVALAGEAALVYGMVRKRGRAEARTPKAAGPIA